MTRVTIGMLLGPNNTQKDAELCTRTLLSLSLAVLQMDQSLLLGNALKVARANERKERPKFPDDRRGGGYGGGSYNGSYDRGGSYGRGGGGYDRGGGSYDRGGHNSYDRDRGRDYDRGSGYKSGGYEGEIRAVCMYLIPSTMYSLSFTKIVV